nr:MAG TPA: hypothetical protein [Caudoviricetes sp.]
MPNPDHVVLAKSAIQSVVRLFGDFLTCTLTVSLMRVSF